MMLNAALRNIMQVCVLTRTNISHGSLSPTPRLPTATKPKHLSDILNRIQGEHLRRGIFRVFYPHARPKGAQDIISEQPVKTRREIVLHQRDVDSTGSTGEVESM